MNIIQFIEAKLDLNREELQIKGAPVPIIEIDDNVKSLVRNAEADQAHLIAVCYGLRSGIKPLISKKDYELADMKEVVSDFFTEEEIKEVAEGIFVLSEFELPTPTEEETEEETEEDEFEPRAY